MGDCLFYSYPHFLIIKRKTLFEKKWLSLASVISILSPLIFALIVNIWLKPGVLLVDSEVKEGPSNIFENSLYIKAGTKVGVSKVTEGWVYISRPLSLSGWVERPKIGMY